jgi:hypothetical protein
VQAKQKKVNKTFKYLKKQPLAAFLFSLGKLEVLITFIIKMDLEIPNIL